MRKLLLTIIITFKILPSNAQDTLESKASFYHSKFNGRKTATGERYDERKSTAASNFYPLGTKLLIISKADGRSVIVTVNDRTASYIKRIDLSKYAFRKIAPLAQGTQKVKIIQIL